MQIATQRDMTIYQTDLDKYPEFLKYLISLCQEDVGYEEQVVAIECVTDEPNLKNNITGFNIRYVAYSPNKEYINWITINTWRSKDKWNMINDQVKSVLRNRQLEKIGI